MKLNDRLHIVILAYQTRAASAKALYEDNELTIDDVIGVQTALGELQKLIGGTTEDVQRKREEWEKLKSNYISLGDKGGVLDSFWVLGALDELEGIGAK